MRIFIAIEPVDFRNGIDGLTGICRQKLEEDPFSGHIFLFRNKRGTSIKAIFYDGQGFWMCQKRLSEGRFKYWPKSTDEKEVKLLDIPRLQLLCWNGDPDSATVGDYWKPI